MTRITRTPITAQQAEQALTHIATDARRVATALGALLDQSAIPDPVAVSLSLRARALLRDATEHLEAAAQRMEGEE
jgi:hypothetical protein